MHIVGAVGCDLLQAQPVEDAEDHQRYHALGRRRQVVERAQAVRQRERFDQFGAVAVQVGQRDRAADRGEIRGDRLRQLAAIKVVQAGAGEVAQQRCAMSGWKNRLPCAGGLPSARKHPAKPGCCASSGSLGRGAAHLAGGDGHAALRVMDRIG